MRLIDTTDERLYVKTKKVENPKSFSIKMLKDKMVKLMDKEEGIGLSSTQIGRDEAMFVMYTDKGIITCINPTILWESSEKIIMKEGCLSFPKTYIALERPKTIIAQYTNLKGEIVTQKMSGMDARCYQHELDHLHGITFIHRQNEKIPQS
jgi:peptide deformylase